MHDVLEEFITKQSTEEANTKGEKFSELAKRNELHHHLGMIGYAAKTEEWLQEEREVAEARQLNPLQGVDERSRNYLYARKPKKLKEGRTKYNASKVEEVEKRILEVSVAEKSGSFEPSQERDVLAEELGNPKHCSHVRGVSLRQSWKDMEAYQSDANSYHMRQRYKEGLI